MDIDAACFKKLTDAHAVFFYHYDVAPLLIIYTAYFDPVNGSRNFKVLPEHICSLPPGRHYFNTREL